MPSTGQPIGQDHQVPLQGVRPEGTPHRALPPVQGQDLGAPSLHGNAGDPVGDPVDPPTDDGKPAEEEPIVPEDPTTVRAKVEGEIEDERRIAQAELNTFEEDYNISGLGKTKTK